MIMLGHTTYNRERCEPMIFICCLKARQLNCPFWRMALFVSLAKNAQRNFNMSVIDQEVQILQ